MADITLNEIRLRRSFDAGYRPGMAGSEALGAGEPFVNFADGVLCIGMVGGDFLETALEFEDRWASFTPVLTTADGPLTSARASCKYIQRGKSVTFRMLIEVFINGSVGGHVLASLPVAPVASDGIPCVLVGRNAMSGAMLQCIVGENAGNIKIYKYDNAYPVASSQVMFVSGTYEAA